MKAIPAAMLTALCTALPGMALGQTTTTTPVYGSSATDASAGQTTSSSGSGWTMPYQRGFWGHAGLSVGRSELNADCTPGFACDDSDVAWRAFAGGRFNNAIGAEVAYLNLGKFRRGGGETESHGLDFALVAGVPFGTNNNWSVFGKLGTYYGWNDVSGIGVASGDDEGFSPRLGIGLQMGLNENWALRADLDRYRVRLPGGREDVDTLMLGAQYTFR